MCQMIFYISLILLIAIPLMIDNNGCYTAQNLDFYKIISQMAFKLYIQSCKKLIIFRLITINVIQDIDSEDCNQAT